MSHHTVKFKGNPLELEGSQIKVGDKAPEFTVIANDLSPVSFGTPQGKVRLISVVPSLDTPVCDSQTRKFNEEAAKLGDKVEFITISVDLPFAQARWCGAAGIKNIKVLSDYRDLSFGKAYGVAIKNLRLLARSIFIIGLDNQVKYVEYVPELTNHPDYDAALKAVKNI